MGLPTLRRDPPTLRYSPPPLEGSRSHTKFLGFLVVIGLIALLVTIDAKRRAAEDQLTQLSVRLEQVTGNPQQNKEKAKQIVDRVKRLIMIGDDIEPTVATIVDVNALRAKNHFYDKAKNGNYLIVTTERAILYDAEKDMILDVVPVQIQAPAAAAAQSSAAKSYE